MDDVQKGAASIWVRSTTRRPASAPPDGREDCMLDSMDGGLRRKRPP
ncbi:hypothetical protein N234_06465 [Ralstonia pickettii DTP0602]|nr:hypothetical protein N234_06465 [Ralstonia pickettii DTP0602]